MHTVEGRVVIVTGSGQGVGRGMAHHFAKAGATVVVADWNAEKMARTVAELEGLGRARRSASSATSWSATRSRRWSPRRSRSSVASTRSSTTRRRSGPTRRWPRSSADDVDVFYRSGVLGTLWAMQAVYPHMKAAGWGRIVNFASSMGIVGGAGFGAYNASKEAIRALTRTAAKEWAADGIVVNAIAPAAAPPRAVGSAHYEEFMRTSPMHRNGDPELDIGSVAHFLCTDACRYLTGQTFMCDGGTYLWA